jgi:hypothetical protein
MGRFLVEVVASDSAPGKRPCWSRCTTTQLVWSPPTRDRYGNVYHGYWRPDRFGPRYIGDREVLRTVQVNRLAVRILDTRGQRRQAAAVFENTSAIYEGDNWKICRTWCRIWPAQRSRTSRAATAAWRW